jgi:hypothetical protein
MSNEHSSILQLQYIKKMFFREIRTAHESNMLAQTRLKCFIQLYIYVIGPYGLHRAVYPVFSTCGSSSHSICQTVVTTASICALF